MCGIGFIVKKSTYTRKTVVEYVDSSRRAGLVAVVVVEERESVETSGTVVEIETGPAGRLAVSADKGGSVWEELLGAGRVAGGVVEVGVGKECVVAGEAVVWACGAGVAGGVAGETVGVGHVKGLGAGGDALEVVQVHVCVASEAFCWKLVAFLAVLVAEQAVGCVEVGAGGALGNADGGGEGVAVEAGLAVVGKGGAGQAAEVAELADVVGGEHHFWACGETFGIVEVL